MSEDDHTHRRLAMKTLAVGLLAAAAAILCARLVLRQLVHDMRTQDRFSQLVDHLPDICAARDPVIAIGSSLTSRGFTPSVFDDRLATLGIHATTFNAGADGVTPDVMLQLTRRLRECFANANNTPRAILIEFTPHMATRAMVRSGIEGPQNAMRLWRLLDVDSFIHVARRSSQDAGHELALLFLGGESPAAAHTIIQDALFPDPPAPVERSPTDRVGQLRQTPEYIATLARFQAMEEGTPHSWDLARRGEIESPAQTPREEEIWREVRRTDTARLQQRRGRLVKYFDLIDLDFEPALIDDLIATIREAQAITPHTYVVIYPRNPGWSMPSPTGTRNLLAVLARIEHETGAPTLNLVASTDFTPDDFADAVHVEDAWTSGKLSGIVARWVGAAQTAIH
jgi:hypothetical protein